MNANGHTPVINLVRHANYQRELLELMCSLTFETAAGSVNAAKSDSEAIDAIVKFRRRWGLPILDDQPNFQPTYYLVALHRAIIRSPMLMRRAEKIPPDDDAMRARGIINYSEHWLIRQGHSTDVDTEFNPKPREPKFHAG